jgi:diguanylate cyclase (GGDEF)-like protein/PAS domain S-box-containing protein
MPPEGADDKTHRQLEASELRLRVLAESASDVVSYRTDDGREEWVSASVEQQVGWTPDEFIAREFEEFVPERYQPTLAAMRATVRDERREARGEVEILTKDGSLRWISLLAKPVLGDDGAVVGRTLSWRDVQDEVMARQALAESEERFRLIAETASDIVYAVGADRRVTWMSPSVTQALGWRPDQLVGTIMSDLVHPDDLAWSAERRDRLYAGDPEAEAAGSFILRMRTAAGDYAWVKTTLTTHRDAVGNAVSFTGGMTRVDELVEARAHAAEQAELFHTMSDSLLDPHVLVRALRDESGTIVDFVHLVANSKASTDYDRTQEEMQGLLLSVLEPGEAETGITEMFIHARESGEAISLTAFHYVNRVTGEEAFYDVHLTPLSGDRLSIVWRDVTEQHRVTERLVESEQRYRLLAEHSSDVVQLSRNGLLVWVSPSLTKILGWRPEEWLHRGFDEFVHPDDLQAMHACQAEVIAGHTKVFDLRVRHPDGNYHWVQASAGPFYDADGGRDGVVSSLRIVDEQVAAQEALEFKATYDDLTGVLKREAAIRRLSELDGGERAGDRAVALLFIDLDEFKVVNDTWGHVAGDALLRAVAQRIESVVRANDVVARLGGDEFLVVLDGIEGQPAAAAIADKVRAVCSQPVATPTGTVATTLSVGVVLREAGETSDALIARADRAMYAAKRAGRDQTVVAPLA